MKLEALDKNNPCNYCVATVIEIVGHRVRIRYDGFGDNDSQDFWCNFQAEELYPIGWCAENSFPLQPPTGELKIPCQTIVNRLWSNGVIVIGSSFPRSFVCRYSLPVTEIGL